MMVNTIHTILTLSTILSFVLIQQATCDQNNLVPQLLCENSNETCQNDNDPTIIKWPLDSEHRCNIQRINYTQLYTMYKNGLPPLYHEPIIIYNDDDNKNSITRNSKKNRKPQPSGSWSCDPSIFFEMTSLSKITKSLPLNFNVTLSSSNSFSEHRRVIPLELYLDETIHHEVLPFQKSNETWYLFGETYSADWKTLLDQYCLPPCQTCTKDLSAIAFGIGGRGSGVQWHIHGPGFSQSIHGRKHWVLYPPEEKPTYDPDYASRHWMEEVYTSLESQHLKLPWECTLHPGDMIYFPHQWHHATINLDKYTVFVSTFTTEHGV